MPVTITLPDTLAISIRFGGNKSFEVDTTALSAEMIERALCHGLKQKIDDRMAGIKDSNHDGHATAREVMESIYDGSWTLRGGATSDPVGAFVRDRAEHMARLKFTDAATGRYVVQGKVVSKLDPKLVKAVRDRFLAWPAWVEAEKAKYVPPSADEALPDGFLDGLL